MYKKDGPFDVYVDTKAIPDLYKCKVSSNIIHNIYSKSTFNSFFHFALSNTLFKYTLFYMFFFLKLKSEINCLFQIGSQIDIGANVTLSTLIDLMEQVKGHAGFEFAGDMADHIKRVASTPVRNVRKEE